MRHSNWDGIDETAKKFIESQRPNTLSTYKTMFKLFMEFTGLTGQQILESKKADSSKPQENRTYEWENKTIEFKLWLKKQKKTNGQLRSDAMAKLGVNVVRSFFDYYRTKLEFSQTERRKIVGNVQRNTSDYLLTNQDLAKLVSVADLREKYIILMGKSLGLRASDFTTLTYGSFRSINLNEEAPVFLGEITTKKENIKAYSFIDADALPIIKDILEINKDKPNNEKIITIREEELTTILQNLAKKANMNLGEKHLRFHCLRKYLCDRLATNMSDSKWRQIVGKKISEDAYVTPLDLLECYKTTMKFTNINSNGRAEKEIQELNKELQTKATIINALVADKTVKDLELEKMKEQISAIQSQIAKFDALFTRMINGEQFAAIPIYTNEEAIKALIETPIERQIDPTPNQDYMKLRKKLLEEKTTPKTEEKTSN